MKCLYPALCVILILLSNMTVSHAGLTLKVAEPKIYGQKAILKLELQNTFTNTIDSVRAAVFLLDDGGKIVGQETRWIVGGTKDRPPLSPNAKTTFHFVVKSEKPFAKTKVTVTRIVLEGGRLANIYSDVEMVSVTK